MIPKHIKYEENLAFISFSNEKEGLLFDDSKHEKYPIRYYNIINNKGLPELSNDCSYYGFVYSGSACIITQEHNNMFISEGSYFSVNGTFISQEVIGSKFILIEVLHTKGIYPETQYRAMNTFGGVIEEVGRLKYIDGCTDSLLIPPVKMGDPCLNHLHFPKNITQTAHTHPSHRIGIVSDGYGECVTPFGTLPLVKGMIFVIKEWYEGMENSEGVGLDGKIHLAGTHKFDTTDSHMDVIAFHPDSDFGATDIVHPMINRTIVQNDEGEFVSAGSIETIRTQ